MFKKVLNHLGINHAKIKESKKSGPFMQKSYFMDSGKVAWSGRDYHTFANEAYIKNVIAHKAINMISKACSSVPFSVKVNGSEDSTTAQEITNLLTRPNPSESGKDMLYSLYAYRQINGNAYLLASTDGVKIVELYSLRPDRIRINTSSSLVPVSYRYSNGRQVSEYYVDSITGFAQVLHLKNFNPLNDFYGLSSIEAASYSIDQHNQAAAWNQSLLQNGARPSGALVVTPSASSPTLTDEQFTRLKSMIEENFAGAANSGRPLILEGGLDWKEMGFTPRDMDFIECKNSAARDIALAFGIPPQLLGIPGDNTYSNLKEARHAFWEQTVIPLLDSTLESLSNWFSCFYQCDVKISSCLDNVPIFSEKRESMWERVKNADFLSDEEKREMLGLSKFSERTKRTIH